MSEYEKLKRIIDEIDPLIKSGTTSSGVEFENWQGKAELFVNRHFGADSLEYKKFVDISYYRPDYSALYGYASGSNHVAECQKGLKLAKGMLESFLEDMEDECVAIELNDTTEYNFQKVFIVHGHDGELKEAVARIIEKQNIEAIILSEKANKGRTIIEKFEDYSDVGGAICLFTSDDIAREKDKLDETMRARQNVVFEAGFFMGKLGRDHVLLLADSGVEMPSDLSGVVYTNTRNWQFDLLKELIAMGYSVDANKLLNP